MSFRRITQTFQTIKTLGRSYPTYPASRIFAHNMSSAVSQRLSGKTVVVTGASSGIGRSTAIEFARTSPKDLKLVVTARRLEALEELKEQIKKEVGEGVKVLPVKLDVSDPEQVRSFVGNLPEEYRDINILVNNA